MHRWRPYGSAGAMKISAASACQDPPLPILGTLPCRTNVSNFREAWGMPWRAAQLHHAVRCSHRCGVFRARAQGDDQTILGPMVQGAWQVAQLSLYRAIDRPCRSHQHRTAEVKQQRGRVRSQRGCQVRWPNVWDGGQLLEPALAPPPPPASPRMAAPMSVMFMPSPGPQWVAIDQSPNWLRPGWSSGRRPNVHRNLRSLSTIGRSLMLAWRAAMKPHASNSQFSLPYERNQLPASSCHS